MLSWNTCVRYQGRVYMKLVRPDILFPRAYVSDASLLLVRNLRTAVSNASGLSPGIL